MMTEAPLEPCLPDASEGEFASQIGLDLRVPEHKALYWNMKVHQPYNAFDLEGPC